MKKENECVQLMTQKEFIEEHKKYLNKEFVKEHPEGQFVIQRRRSGYVSLYVNFKRRTSHVVPLYPNAFGIEHSNESDFYFVRSQNNSFDKVTIYKTLDMFLIGCKKYNVRNKAIQEFLFFYNNKNSAFIKKVKKNMYFKDGICEWTVPGKESSVWKSD